jgi:dienelactone hydrolase
MPSPADVTRQRVVLGLPGTDAVTVRRDVGPLRMDLYRSPAARAEARLPALVFVAGYPDAGMEAVVGRKLKDWQAYGDWGRLAAVSGLVGITYSAAEPAADARALIAYVREHAAELGIDPARIGLWACSGNAPTALSLLLGAHGPSLRCAALLYGYTLDLDGATGVADAAKSFGFANPCAGATPGQLPPDVPLLVVRAGADALPGLNASLDRTVAHALAANRPLELVNLPDAPHGFDIAVDSEPARDAIRGVLAFATRHI